MGHPIELTHVASCVVHDRRVMLSEVLSFMVGLAHSSQSFRDLLAALLV